jgi:hypothetical protein
MIYTPVPNVQIRFLILLYAILQSLANAFFCCFLFLYFVLLSATI